MVDNRLLYVVYAEDIYKEGSKKIRLFGLERKDTVRMELDADHVTLEDMTRAYFHMRQFQDTVIENYGEVCMHVSKREDECIVVRVREGLTPQEREEFAKLMTT